jgi:hypothetical protein
MHSQRQLANTAAMDGERRAGAAQETAAQRKSNDQAPEYHNQVVRWACVMRIRPGPPGSNGTGRTNQNRGHAGENMYLNCRSLADWHDDRGLCHRRAMAGRRGHDGLSVVDGRLVRGLLTAGGLRGAAISGRCGFLRATAAAARMVIRGGAILMGRTATDRLKMSVRANAPGHGPAAQQRQGNHAPQDAGSDVATQ